MGNKGKRQEKSSGEGRSNGGEALAGLDKECDYAPGAQKERKKMKVGMDTTLKRKLNPGSQWLGSLCTSLC